MHHLSGGARAALSTYVLEDLMEYVGSTGLLPIGSNIFKYFVEST